MKQFFGKKKLAKLVTLSVMTGAMLGIASGAWAGVTIKGTETPENYSGTISSEGERNYVVDGGVTESRTYGSFVVTTKDGKITLSNGTDIGALRVATAKIDSANTVFTMTVDSMTLNVVGEHTTFGGSYATAHGIHVSGAADENFQYAPTLNLTVANDLNIAVNGTDTYTYGIHVANRTENSTSENLATANISAKKISITSVASTIEYPGAIVVFSQGRLYMNNYEELYVEVKDKSGELGEAICTRGNAVTEINKNETGKKTQIYGNIMFENGDDAQSGTGVDAIVDLHLVGEKSEFKGNIINVQAIPEGIGGKPSETVTGMKMFVKDGAKAEFTNTSFVNSLTADGGKIEVDAGNFIVAQKVAGRNANGEYSVVATWMSRDTGSDGTGTLSLKDSEFVFNGTNQTADIEVLTANGSTISADKGASINIVGTDSQHPSSLTKTDVDGVHFDLAEGAKLTVDGGTFTVPNFTRDNYLGYSCGAVFFAYKNTELSISNAIIQNSSAPTEKGVAGALYAGKTAKVTLENVKFVDNTGYEIGAVGLFSPNNVLKNVTFERNEVLRNTYEKDAGVGALFFGSVSQAEIIGDMLDGCSFVENTSNLSAGAIGTRFLDTHNNVDAMLDISKTIFEGNTAVTEAGAFSNHFYNSSTKARTQTAGEAASAYGQTIRQNGYVYIGDSKFTDNKVTGEDGKGGAIFNAGKSNSTTGDVTYHNFARLYIENTSFTGNEATGKNGKGGAIYNDEGAVIVLDNVTFSGNKANNVANDIYNAGELELKNVKLDGGVNNAATGTIKVGEGTRVLVKDVDIESANLIGTLSSDKLTMAGGTLVTSNITVNDYQAYKDTEKGTKDEVAGADKFTMTSGVVEYGADYYLTDATKWAGVVKGLSTTQDAFSLKLTGKLIKNPLIQEEIALTEVQELGLQAPEVDVKVDDELLQEFTEEGETKKQLIIGDMTGTDTDKNVKKDVVVHDLNVGAADKIVISPADNKEILVEVNGAIIRNNDKTQKLDMDLREGAGVKIISEETLELGTLQALNNDKLTVTLQGNFKADDFKVKEDLEGQQVITFVVGGAESEKPSSLVLKNAKDTDKLQVFVDPFIAKDIGEASSYSQGGTDVKAEIIAGRNSLIVLGETDRTKAEEVFNSMQAGLTFGNAGDVNAVLYVAKPQTMAAGSKLYLDGRLTNKDDATENAQFYAAPKSLTMIAANICDKDNAAISEVTSAQVDNGAKLYIEGAEVGTYKVLGATTGLNGWQATDILANSLVKVDTDPSASQPNDGFYVKFKQAEVDLSDTVMPGVGEEMAKAAAGSPAREAMKEMLSDLYTKDQKAANVNAYANLGENLGVTRGAYDVANMVGNAVTEHWDNNAKGENIWAVYTRNKTDVDGMELGGMEAQYDAHYNGVVVGADLGKGFGIAVNYADGNVSNYLGGHNDSEYYGASLYGRKVWGNFSLNLDAGYTYGKNELAQNGIEADAKTDTISAGLTAKYLAKAGKYDKIGLFAGARYLHIDGRDYTDSLGVNREADKINSVVVPVGLEYTGNFKMAKSAWTFKPVLAVGYLFNLGDRENDMTMRYGGAEDVFGYDFVDKGAFFTHAGMDFEKKNFTLGISYDFMKSKNSKNNRWNVNANMAF